MRTFMKTVRNAAYGMKLKMFALACALLLGTAPMNAYAVDTSAANWNTSANSINTIIASVIGMILGIAQGVGIVLVVFGIFRIVLASKDGNSNEQSQGIQLAIVGALLVGLRALLKTAGLTT